MSWKTCADKYAEFNGRIKIIFDSHNYITDIDTYSRGKRIKIKISPFKSFILVYFCVRWSLLLELFVRCPVYALCRKTYCHFESTLSSTSSSLLLLCGCCLLFGFTVFHTTTHKKAYADFE